jgi:alkanesulfonate monooxygenase SsuD/methylene tetrahydromethanopterin reductase-like flavin-dependent oxidoreductase (luciferase family)
MDFGFFTTATYLDVAGTDPRQLYRENIDQAVLAEQVGFTEISVPEHHFINYLNIPSPLAWAVKLAERTEKARIVIAVLVMPFYDPRRLAGEIALVDALTDGRVEFGFGRGGFRYEFDRMGVEFDVDTQRRQFSEGIKVLDLLLTQEDVTFEGEFWKWTEPLTIMPRPSTKPRPPFHIAAVGEGGIRWAAASGNHLITTALRSGWSAVEPMAEWFNDERSKLPAGSARPRHTTQRNVYVSRDKRDLEEKANILLTNHRQFTALFSESAQSQTGARGAVDTESLGDVRGGQIQLADVSLTAEEAAANTLIGEPEWVAEQILRYAELDVDSVHVNMAFGASHADVCRSIELFGTEVIPAVSSALKG